MVILFKVNLKIEFGIRFFVFKELLFISKLVPIMGKNNFLWSLLKVYSFKWIINGN